MSTQPIISWVLTGRIAPGRAALAWYNLAVPAGGLRLYGRAFCSTDCWQTTRHLQVSEANEARRL